MRMCVSAAYEQPYEETPEIFGGPGSGNAPEFQRVYEQWAADLGYRWWFSREVAPCHFRRWIATVPGLEEGGTHAVVMERDRLWFDPSSLSEGKVPAYSEIKLSDVRTAKWLERLAAKAPRRGGFRPIAGKSSPGGRIAPSKLEAWADNLPGPGPKVGRNHPCRCGSGKKFKRCCGA